MGSTLERTAKEAGSEKAFEDAVCAGESGLRLKAWGMVEERVCWGTVGMEGGVREEDFAWDNDADEWETLLLAGMGLTGKSSLLGTMTLR